MLKVIRHNLGLKLCFFEMLFLVTLGILFFGSGNNDSIIKWNIPYYLTTPGKDLKWYVELLVIVVSHGSVGLLTGLLIWVAKKYEIRESK